MHVSCITNSRAQTQESLFPRRAYAHYYLIPCFSAKDEIFRFFIRTIFQITRRMNNTFSLCFTQNLKKENCFVCLLVLCLSSIIDALNVHVISEESIYYSFFVFLQIIWLLRPCSCQCKKYWQQ